MITDEEAFIISMYKELINMLKEKDEYDDVMDLHTAFGAYDANDSLFVDWIHTNAHGDRVICDLIFDYMMDKDLINTI